MVPGRTGGRRERPHRPHELGPRIFSRGRWKAADLRPWGGGRPTLRNPSARGWPKRGSRTEDDETARRWSWAYVDTLRARAKQHHLGLPDDPGTLAEARDGWLDHQSLHVADKTWEGGRTATGHLLDHLGASFPVEEISAAKLQELFDRFLEDGYAASTLDTMRRQLSAFFAWVGVDPNPARVVDLPYTHRGEAEDWNDGQLQTIRDHAGELRPVIELALGTGARQSELFALQDRDMRSELHTVRIVRQLDRAGTGFAALKGKKGRTSVVLPFTWAHVPDREGLLFPGPDGAPLKPRQSRDLLVGVLEAAGLYVAGVGWHRFRHTYARLFLEAGGSMEQLRMSLGHASTRTTELFYDHFRPDMAAELAVENIYGKGRRLRAM